MENNPQIISSDHKSLVSEYWDQNFVATEENEKNSVDLSALITDILNEFPKEKYADKI